MEYERKYNRQKAIFAGSISVVLIAIVLVVSFWIGPSMITDNPEKTLPPDTTLPPVEGDLSIFDEHLVNAIKKQLNITGDIQKSDMERLEVLDYDEETITNLAGLEFAINLKELRLKIDVTTIEPIKELHINKLTFISDISVQSLLDEIKEMKYLRYLDLSDCGISAVGYISELPMLETLILDNNRISGLHYLSQMNTLAVLSLKNCGIKSITGLTNNVSIRSLYIDNNLIEDISVIETMPSLVDVTYEGNPIKDSDSES